MGTANKKCFVVEMDESLQNFLNKYISYYLINGRNSLIYIVYE